MFTGLIQHRGEVASNRKNHLRVRTKHLKANLGESIAINGVCLTLTRQSKVGKSREWEFDVSEETLRKTTLGQWKPGTIVNVEPAMRLTDALGGHIVQGHVDGIGRVAKIRNRPSSREMWFDAPKEIMRGVVAKGSVAVDGVSLTAAEISKKGFCVSLIPATWENTTLGNLVPGDSVNLETDIIGKYVERYIRKK